MKVKQSNEVTLNEHQVPIRLDEEENTNNNNTNNTERIVDDMPDESNVKIRKKKIDTYGGVK